MIRKILLRARLGVLLASAAASLPAVAAGLAPFDQEAQDLDQAIQALKQEVLDIDSRGKGIEQNTLYPAFSRVTVYVGVTVKTLQLRTISVSIDDGNTVTYQVNDDEARALQDGKVGGLLTLLRANAGPGTHRLKADFTASYFESKPETAPMHGHYEAFFTKDQDPAELELTIEQNGFRADPALKLRDWKAAR
jgi:hypothetical protein